MNNTSDGTIATTTIPTTPLKGSKNMGMECIEASPTITIPITCNVILYSTSMDTKYLFHQNICRGGNTNIVGLDCIKHLLDVSPTNGCIHIVKENNEIFDKYSIVCGSYLPVSKDPLICNMGAEIGETNRSVILSGIDGNPLTNAFETSPETCTVLKCTVNLSFNPATDTIKTKNGNESKFKPPTDNYLPLNEFDSGIDTYQPPAKDGSNLNVIVDRNSQRLQLLEPFKSLNGNDIKNAVVSIKMGVMTGTYYSSIKTK